MNSTLKTIIYLLLGLMVAYFVIPLFFMLLLYLVLGGFLFYGYFKIKQYFLKKRMKNTRNNYTKTYTSNTKWSEEVKEEDHIVDDVVEVIDVVDYEDVK